MKSLILAIVVFPYASYGTVVTTATDEDNGSLGGGTGVSLREAVKYSPAGNTITFAPALSGQTIRLTLGEIVISQSLTIDGSALPSPITLSGDKTGDGQTADDTRILNITTGTIILESLILTRGYKSSGPNAYGGAIHVDSTTTQLTIRNSTLSNNESTTYGGAIYFLGTLNSPSSFLKLENCTVSGNDTGHDGGAIRIFGRLLVYASTFIGNTAFQGGAIYTPDGTSNIEKSIFLGNSAITEGGAIWNYRTLNLTSTTFSGNSAPYGGAIYCSFAANLTLENSTLTANTARDYGGGIFISGATTTIRHSTLTGNTALAGGGGMWRKTSGATPVGTLSLNRSIVVGNSAPTTPNVDISGTFTGSNNLTSGDSRLAPLGDYGGPTQTMPPLPGSPAINAGGTTTLTTDQRGFSRVGAPDIGAAEYQGSADLTRFWKLDFDGDGSLFGVEQALGTDPLISDSTNSRNLTAPVFNAFGHAILSFGLASAPAPGTVWILKRSPDLSPGSFTEIYRYDGSADSAAPGFGFLRTVSSVTVTDESPFTGGGFYRFEASLEP